MPRRAHGEGTVRRRKDGRWEGRVSLGYDAQGKRKRKSVIRHTQAEVVAEMRVLKAAVDAGRAPVKPTTLRAYAPNWLAGRAAAVKPRSLENDRSDLARYVLPHLGAQSLDKLDLRTLKLHQSQLAEDHGRYTANRVRRLLHNLLGDAVREGYLTQNPAQHLRPLRLEPKEVRIWSAEEVHAALGVAKASTRLYPLFYLALSTGLRPGELYGLMWSRLFFSDDSASLKVDQAVEFVRGKPLLGTPKNTFSKRTLALSGDAAEVLREQRQRLRLERQGLALPARNEASALRYEHTDLVFPSSRGTFLSETNVRRALQSVIRQAGVTPITLKSMRHTFASMMIASGVDVVRLSRMLGHTSPNITLKVYSHLFERHQREPMPSLSDLTGKPLGGQVGGQMEEDAPFEF